MATILNGITGGFSGKVGNIIGGSWKGIDYMRSRATSISQPNTPAQMEQRAKFSTVGKFLRPLIPFLRIGYKSLAIKKSGYNAAMAYTLDNAITGVYPDYAIDYTKMLVSQGSLPGALNPEIDGTTPGQVDFTWDQNPLDTNAKADDKALVVVYNPFKGQAVTIVGGNTRASGSQTINLPASFAGDEVQCFIGFKSATQPTVSNSQLAGSILVA